MTTNIQLLRSSVAYKRPSAAPLLDGQAAVNYNAAEPGLFFRLTDGTLSKVGPVSVTTDGSRPNSAPAGETGNSTGEQWLNANPVLYRPVQYIYNGSEFVTSSGFVVDEASGNFTLERTLTAQGLEGNSLNIQGPAVIGGNITPNGQNCAYFLGGPTERWDNAYLCNLDVSNGVNISQISGGTITLGDGCGASNVIANAEVTFNCDATPSTDNTVNLGSPTNRFANIYTGDLHLRNDRGDWTVIEEEEYLSIKNNKSGKTFRLVMEEVS